MVKKMSVKTQVKHILLESSGEYFSGAALARTLGVSRNAVWKAIQELEKQGFPVESKKSVGYRMVQAADLLTEEDIRKYLHTKYLGNILIVKEIMDSTNDYCRNLLQQGTIRGTVVVSNEQVAGRGRQGKRFYSPGGCGLYFSVIVNQDFQLQDASVLTACAAVATSRAIDKLYHTHTQIKWVNDVYLNGKKICGILTEGELSLESVTMSYAIVGIGINVRNTEETMPQGLRSTVSSIEEEVSDCHVQRCALLAAILYEMEQLISEMTERRFLAEYRQRSCLIGKRVEWVETNGTVKKVAVMDITDDCALVTQDTFGNVETHYGGTIGKILED